MVVFLENVPASMGAGTMAVGVSDTNLVSWCNRSAGSDTQPRGSAGLTVQKRLEGIGSAGMVEKVGRGVQCGSKALEFTVTDRKGIDLDLGHELSNRVGPDNALQSLVVKKVGFLLGESGPLGDECLHCCNDGLTMYVFPLLVVATDRTGTGTVVGLHRCHLVLKHGRVVLCLFQKELSDNPVDENGGGQEWYGLVGGTPSARGLSGKADRLVFFLDPGVSRQTQFRADVDGVDGIVVEPQCGWRR